MISRHTYPAMIALSALLTAPVLAQSLPTQPTTPSTTAAPSPGQTMKDTLPAPKSPLASTTSAQTSSKDTYVTADQQVRASKLIGSTVYNDQQEKVGSIDELLMNSNHDVKDVVLSVGGFLGVGSKLVKVPYNQLQVAGDTIVLPGVTKTKLSEMPTYSYTGAG